MSVRILVVDEDPKWLRSCGSGLVLRRVSPVAVRLGEGPLTERTASVQQARRELVFMPPKATFVRAARRYLKSFDQTASFLSHDGTTAETNRRRRAVVHD